MPGLESDYPLSLFRDAIRSTFAAVFALLCAVAVGTALGILASNTRFESYFLPPIMLLEIPFVTLAYAATVPGLLLTMFGFLCLLLYLFTSAFRFEFLLVISVVVCLDVFLALSSGLGGDPPWLRFVACVAGVALFYGTLHVLSHWLRRRKRRNRTSAC